VTNNLTPLKLGNNSGIFQQNRENAFVEYGGKTATNYNNERSGSRDNSSSVRVNRKFDINKNLLSRKSNPNSLSVP
jgi:hypothetical protein